MERGDERGDPPDQEVLAETVRERREDGHVDQYADCADREELEHADHLAGVPGERRPEPDGGEHQHVFGVELVLARRELGLAVLAVAEHVRHLDDGPVLALDEQFEEDLVPLGVQHHVLNQLASDREEPRHRVAASPDLGDQRLREQARALAHDLPSPGPVLDPTAVDVAAPDRHVGAVFQRGQQVGEFLWRVLEVGVDNRTGVVPRASEPLGDRLREPLVVRPPDHPDPRVVPVPLAGDLPGPVRGVVVDDEQFERPAGERFETPVDDAFDVLTLVVGRNDDRDGEGLSRGSRRTSRSRARE